MPNAKVLSEKQAIVAELTEKLKTASSGVLVDYKGITVAQDTALRAECRKNELDYAVVKNTLVRFAINNVGLEEMDSVLNGTTSLALSHGDPIAPMRVINKFAKQFNGEKFTIKAGFMDGKVLSLDEIKALCEPILAEHRFLPVFFDITRTGRHLWIAVYFQIEGGSLGVSDLSRASAAINDAAQERYQDCTCELILAPEVSPYLDC